MNHNMKNLLEMSSSKVHDSCLVHFIKIQMEKDHYKSRFEARWCLDSRGYCNHVPCDHLFHSLKNVTSVAIELFLGFPASCQSQWHWAIVDSVCTDQSWSCHGEQLKLGLVCSSQPPPFFINYCKLGFLLFTIKDIWDSVLHISHFWLFVLIICQIQTGDNIWKSSLELQMSWVLFK